MHRLRNDRHFARTLVRYRLRTLLIALALGPLGIAWIYSYFFRPLPFERRAWIREDWKRPRMAADLMSNRLLIGKSHDEVISLLGFPNGDTPNEFLYASSNFDGSLGWMNLVVRFEEGRAVEVKRNH
jgi:hypothetical protein